MANLSLAPKEVKLPLSTVLPYCPKEFCKEAEVVFRSGSMPEVHHKKFHFVAATLKKAFDQPALPARIVHRNDSFPIFSALAVLLLVLFRNLFHQSFAKYFISFRNNYEIDFSIQKIGIPATIFSACINLLAFSDFIRNFLPLGAGSALFLSFQLLLFPALISMGFLFLTSATIRFFPLVFPDLKIQLFLSLFLLASNFYMFGQGGSPIPAFFGQLPLFLLCAFFLYRSVIFLEVLGKYYRYQSTVSLFYICSLNLATFIVIHKVLL